MWVTRLIIKAFSKPLLILSGRRISREGEDLSEVFEVLSAYRSLRDVNNIIFVESFQPLTDSDRENIRKFLRVSEDTKMVEHRSAALIGSLRFTYRGRVYSYQDNNRLHKLKELFIYS